MGSSIAKLFYSNNFGGLTESARILMLGLDGAGKTTVLYRLRLGEVRWTTPTLGFNVETIEYRNIKFNVWDMAGQQRIRKLWHHYYENAAGLIYVVDSNDVDRLELAAKELNKLITEPALAGLPVLIFANKQDLPYAKSIEEVAKELDLFNVVGHPWHIQSCCAPTGGGLYEGLDWLSGAIEIFKNARKELSAQQLGGKGETTILPGDIPTIVSPG